MRKFIVFINELSLYAVIFSSLFIIQKYTIGKIPYFKDIVIFKMFYMHEIIIIIISIFITVRYFEVKSNYRIKKKF